MRDRIALALYALTIKLSPRFVAAQQLVIQQRAHEIAAQTIASAAQQAAAAIAP